MNRKPVAASDLQIDADPDAPRAARRFSSRFLADLGLSQDARWAPLLIVSELVTNVVRHGGPTLVLSLSSDPGRLLRIAVHDNGGGEVAVSPVGAEGGRGLEIVDTLSTRWGVDYQHAGKTVWCEIDPDHLVVS